LVLYLHPVIGENISIRVYGIDTSEKKTDDEKDVSNLIGEKIYG